MPILYRINERGHTFHKIKRLDINSNRFYLHMRQHFSSISANYVRFSRGYVEYFVRFFDLLHLKKIYSSKKSYIFVFVAHFWNVSLKWCRRAFIPESAEISPVYVPGTL